VFPHLGSVDSIRKLDPEFPPAISIANAFLWMIAIESGLTSGRNAPEALAEVQRDWLVKLRTEKG
jgi:hypothetical protein